MNHPKARRGRGVFTGGQQIAEVIGTRPRKGMKPEDMARAYDPETNRWDPARQVAINLMKDHTLAGALSWCDWKVDEARTAGIKRGREGATGDSILAFVAGVEEFMGHVRDLLRAGVK